MTKLFELLAVEKTRISAANKLAEDASNKFGKDHFFNGHVKTLAMLKDSPENKAIEAALKETKELATTVEETVAYFLDFWAKAEDVVYAKNKTNQIAVADIIFRDAVLKKDVPVDELMGLEVRLGALRGVLDRMPTLDASKEWVQVDDGRKGVYKSSMPEVTTKTEKIMVPVVLYEATDKHPAQLERVTKDDTVGIFTRVVYSGSATSKQKANVLSAVDDLLVAVKQARMRANAVEATNDRIGADLIKLVLDAFKD